MAKKLPLLAPSIHTFEVNGTYTDCEAKRTVFMAIQKMVSAGKYYRIPYHGSSKKGYSYKRKDGGLTITLAEYPDFRKRYITLSGVNLARIAGDPSRLSLTDLSPEGLVMQEQAFLDELEQLGLLEIEDSVKWKMHRLDITQDFYVKCDPSLMVKIIRYAGSVDPYRKGRALHYNQHNEIRSCKFEKTWYDFALYDKHQQLLNCEKESYPISPDNLERSKNLVRYEIQLKRPSLKEFEHDKLESKSSKFRFENHALFHYFDKISDDIPLFLYRYAVDYFGKHSWYNVPTALKAVQMSNLDADNFYTTIIYLYFICIQSLHDFFTILFIFFFQYSQFYICIFLHPLNFFNCVFFKLFNLLIEFIIIPCLPLYCLHLSLNSLLPYFILFSSICFSINKTSPAKPFSFTGEGLSYVYLPMFCRISASSCNNLTFWDF